MTLHIDKDYNKILNMQKALKAKFKPFFLEFDTLALFDYPGEMIETINLTKVFINPMKTLKNMI